MLMHPLREVLDHLWGQRRYVGRHRALRPGGSRHRVPDQRLPRQRAQAVVRVTSLSDR